MWRFDSDTDPGYWVRVDSPTNVTLRDLTATVNGPVAVGDKGVAIGRGRERWGVILENGPGAKGNALYAVDSTDDGERVWFAGAGGALGYYDIVEDERRDYSVPRGNSNSFYSLAVSGARDSEKFLVGDGAGNVLPGHMEETEADWSWATTPSGDNAVEALAHDADGYGYAVTPNANVFVTTQEEWEHIGIDGAQNSFYDCAFADGVLLTGGGGGVLYEAEQLLDHDDDVVWTPTDLGGFAVYGLDAGHGAQLACGEGGNVHVRMQGGDWEQGAHDGSTTFRAGLVDEQMVAVGDGGLVVERRARGDLSEEERSQFDDLAGGSESTEQTQWVTAAEDDAADGSTGNIEWTSEEPGEESGEASSEETAVSGQPPEERAGDGDSFDGRGETYDGDDSPPAERDGHSTDEGDSGNDPADEPDAADNDAADAPDEGGNDTADPPDEDTDSDSDSPDR